MSSLIAQIPLADTWSMHDGDVGFGWWLGMVLFWGAIIAVVVWLLRGGPSAARTSSLERTPRELLDRRLADGSLGVEEYERRRRLLEDARDDAPTDREPAALGVDR
jgi:putative membrane protein